MKKICLCFVLILMVTFCLSACGEESAEGQSSLVLTIAETRPSGVAFEYKDGKPYCFYAYGTQGGCYRVLWNDFDGLEENEKIVVKYDSIKQLTYDEFTSGWTPQYEITATQVRNAAEVVLFRYTWDGWGISSKTIAASEVACDIADALKNMKVTDETVPRISDEELALGGGEYSADRGTLWIEYGGNIYRMAPDLSAICLVDTHFGAGKALEMPEAFGKYVNDAWYYYPYDYYLGTYNPGDKSVELKNRFKADSSIKMRIKDIWVESNYDPQNTVTVELISDTDQEIQVWLNCQQSDDNLARGDGKTVQLKKDTPATVKLTFGGWPKHRYWVYITADNTKSEITINPNK